MLEIWKDVVGFEAKYEVSSLGRVRVCNSGLIRKPQPINKGYLVLKLSPLIGGRQRTRTVHSLVAEAFLGCRPKGAQVNHKDGDKTNNSVTNLEWVSGSENMQHAYAIGLCSPGNPNSNFNGPARPQRGEGNYNARLSEAQALEVIEMLKTGVETSRSISRKFEVSTSLIHAIKIGRLWAHLPR